MQKKHPPLGRKCSHFNLRVCLVSRLFVEGTSKHSDIQGSDEPVRRYWQLSHPASYCFSNLAHAVSIDSIGRRSTNASEGSTVCSLHSSADADRGRFFKRSETAKTPSLCCQAFNKGVSPV